MNMRTVLVISSPQQLQQLCMTGFWLAGVGWGSFLVWAISLDTFNAGAGCASGVLAPIKTATGHNSHEHYFTKCPLAGGGGGGD